MLTPEQEKSLRHITSPRGAVQEAMVSRFLTTGFNTQLALMKEPALETHLRAVFPTISPDDINRIHAVAGTIGEFAQTAKRWSSIEYMRDHIPHAIEEAWLGPISTVTVEDNAIPGLPTIQNQRFVSPQTFLSMYPLEVHRVQYFSRFPKTYYPLTGTVYIAATPYVIRHKYYYTNPDRVDSIMMPRTHLETQIQWSAETEDHLRAYGARIHTSMEISWRRDRWHIDHPVDGSFESGNK